MTKLGKVSAETQSPKRIPSESVATLKQPL